MTLSEMDLEELKTLLERHDQESDCKRRGDCCAHLLIEFLEELLAD